MSSIRLRLLKRLAGPIVLVNLAGAGLTYLLAWTPAQVAFDQGLADAAAGLLARAQAGQGTPALVQDGYPQRDATWFTVRGPGARQLAGTADFPPLRPGVAAYDARLHGEPVRVVALAGRSASGAIEVGVARTLRERSRVRSAILRSLVLLEGLLTLVLVGLAWLSVTNGLLPLARMRANLNAREGGDLAPIADEDVPYELAPVIGAFNDLLGKVQAGAQAQHDFLANMAHQLRTPLAGLKLQLEWLGARHGDDPETARSVRLMRQANERMIRQTNQLLALARASPAGVTQARLERLDLAALVGESVQLFVDTAAGKGLDIGFELEPAVVAGDAFLLRDLVDNLVDNALRYTPAGGTVTVRCAREQGQPVLVVEDSGPGIAPAKRALVFNRFVRLDETSAGSGLGLAIVRDIAHAHRATIELSDMPGGGARFTVRFPAP
jgi:two-component system, OmpR family, sensor histidine kinase TctE